jgi:hypothetical protein
LTGTIATTNCVTDAICSTSALERGEPLPDIHQPVLYLPVTIPRTAFGLGAS